MNKYVQSVGQVTLTKESTQTRRKNLNAALSSGLLSNPVCSVSVGKYLCSNFRLPTSTVWKRPTELRLRFSNFISGSCSTWSVNTCLRWLCRYLQQTHWEVRKVCTGLNKQECAWGINPLNPELNPIFYLLALLGAHHFLHVSRIRIKLLILGY